MLVLKGLVGLHRTIQLQLFHVTGWGIDLDYCDIQWFALETNRDHFVIFEIASKYCSSDSFVDPDGYSISSEGFLLTLVDIIVIRVKFWRRQWHPSPVLLPGKSHGWRSLVGCSPWGRTELDTTEQLHFHFSLSSQASSVFLHFLP